MKNWEKAILLHLFSFPEATQIFVTPFFGYVNGDNILGLCCTLVQMKEKESSNLENTRLFASCCMEF